MVSGYPPLPLHQIELQYLKLVLLFRPEEFRLLTKRYGISELNVSKG
ncbi:MAG: hypothetical protein ACTS8H_00325 [Arsenophonus sp. NC-PE1-MAG3]